MRRQRTAHSAATRGAAVTWHSPRTYSCTNSMHSLAHCAVLPIQNLVAVSSGVLITKLSRVGS
jgi:hypothetical protein